LHDIKLGAITLIAFLYIVLIFHEKEIARETASSFRNNRITFSTARYNFAL